MRATSIFIFIFLLGSPSVFAKPSQPILTQLTLTSVKNLGKSIDYEVDFQCRPLTNSKSILFTLSLPKDFTLEQGFSRWEGYLNAQEIFNQKFIIRGVSDKKGQIVISTKMTMQNKAISFKKTSLILSQQTTLKKASPLTFSTGSGIKDRLKRKYKGRTIRE